MNEEGGYWHAYSVEKYNRSFGSVYGCRSRADKNLSNQLHRFLSSEKVLVNIIKKYVAC